MPINLNVKGNKEIRSNYQKYYDYRSDKEKTNYDNKVDMQFSLIKSAIVLMTISLNKMKKSKMK